MPSTRRAFAIPPRRPSPRGGSGGEARPRSRPPALMLLLLPLLPLAACGEGGEETEAAVQIAEDADPQQLMVELQGIQQELGEIQERALEDPELEADRQSLEERLDAEMESLDPEAPTKQARQEEIAAEFAEARDAGEEETAQELATENRELQADLQQTRQAALQTEQMTTAIEAFQEDMLAAMNEVDPRTDSLVARAEAIVAFLQERMAQQEAAPAPAPDTAGPE